jgi:hypothetical protein
LLNGEIFYTLMEAKILIERWRHEYNTLGIGRTSGLFRITDTRPSDQ